MLVYFVIIIAILIIIDALKDNRAMNTISILTKISACYIGADYPIIQQPILQVGVSSFDIKMFSILNFLNLSKIRNEFSIHGFTFYIELSQSQSQGIFYYIIIIKKLLFRFGFGQLIEIYKVKKYGFINKIIRPLIKLFNATFLYQASIFQNEILLLMLHILFKPMHIIKDVFTINVKQLPKIESLTIFIRMHKKPLNFILISIHQLSQLDNQFYTCTINWNG